MTRILPALTAILLATATSATAGQVEDVEKELVKAHAKLTSFTAKVHTAHQFDRGDGTFVESESKGSHEWKRQGNKVMYRMELTVETRLAIPGRETMVCDGEFMYIYSDKAGRKSAVKLKADARTAGDVTAQFDSLRGDYDLKVLPEETVNGQPCYVIEGTASKELDHPLVRQMTWFSKDLGLAVRIVVYTKAGEVTGRSDTTDIKPNAPIEDDRFTFEAPEGVQVRDLSQLSNEGGG